MLGLAFGAAACSGVVSGPPDAAEPEIVDCRMQNRIDCAPPAQLSAPILIDTLRSSGSSDLNGGLPARQQGPLAPASFVAFGGATQPPALGAKGLTLVAGAGALAGVMVDESIDGPAAPVFRIVAAIRFGKDSPPDGVAELGLSSVRGEGWAAATSSLRVSLEPSGRAKLWNGSRELWSGATSPGPFQVLLDVDETLVGRRRVSLTINGSRVATRVPFSYPERAHLLALQATSPTRSVSVRIEGLEIAQYRRPFPLMATSFAAHLLDDIQTYRDAGLNVVKDSYALEAQAHRAAEAGLPWTTSLNLNMQPLEQLETVADVMASSFGVCIHDEPRGRDMPAVRAMMDSVRARFPEVRVFANGVSAHNPPEILWGDASAPSYDYDAYLDDIVGLGIDALMYDFYPFLKASGVTMPDHLANLDRIRTKALAHQLPYWAYIQSFDSSDFPQRRPSESDLRMQVFTHLGAGFSTLAYWVYGFRNGDGYVDFTGKPAALYAIAQPLNQEVARIGRALVFLTSTDVRFIPGRHTATGGAVVANPPAEGTQAFTPAVGGRLVEVQAGDDPTQPAADGYIGTLKDYKQEYFFVTNLHHGADLTAAATTATFRLRFRDDVDALLRIDRATGRVERLVLTDHTLVVTLPGGTGDLFKYDTGPFAGIDIQ